MKKDTLKKAAIVGGVVATAATAGAVLLSDEKRRKKVVKAVDKTIKKVNTPKMKKRISQAANVVKAAGEVMGASGVMSKAKTAIKEAAKLGTAESSARRTQAAR